MSEGYQCDRYGTTYSGSPDTMLVVGQGRQRSREPLTRQQDAVYHDSPIIGDYEADLCRACMNDLRRWYSDGGGDAAEIEHRDNLEGDK